MYISPGPSLSYQVNFMITEVAARTASERQRVRFSLMRLLLVQGVLDESLKK